MENQNKVAKTEGKDTETEVGTDLAIDLKDLDLKILDLKILSSKILDLIKDLDLKILKIKDNLLSLRKGPRETPFFLDPCGGENPAGISPARVKNRPLVEEDEAAYIARVKKAHNDIPEKQLDEWKGWYSDKIDVETTLYVASTWLLSNTHRRKKNIKRFYANWLGNQYARAQKIKGGKS